MQIYGRGNGPADNKKLMIQASGGGFHPVVGREFR